MFVAYVEADAIGNEGVSQPIHVAFVVPTDFQLVLSVLGCGYSAVICCFILNSTLPTHRRGIILHLESLRPNWLPPPLLPPTTVSPLPEPTGWEGGRGEPIRTGEKALHFVCYTFSSSLLLHCTVNPRLVT